MRQTPKPFETNSASGTAVENGSPATEAASEAGNRAEVDAIELLLVLAEHKKQILQITIATALVALAVVLLLPNIYTATTTILPPQQKQSALSSMLGQVGAIAGLNVTDIGLKNPADIFVAMLTS